MLVQIKLISQKSFHDELVSITQNKYIRVIMTISFILSNKNSFQNEAVSIYSINI